MRRREFVLTAAALAGAGAGAFYQGQRMTASVQYAGREFGHRLRDARLLPAPTETLDTEVLIAGGGAAGLTARWLLAKHSVRDVLLVAGPELHGNAAAGQDGDLVFPTGAHYLPLPSMESKHIREMLADFGIIQSNPFEPRPTFDERFIVHGPAERVLYRGSWQEGYLPSEEVPASERSQHQRFFALVEGLSNARGADGRRAFAVPLEMSSTDARYRELDRVTFRAWLDAAGLASPTLHWYLNYCCRDDYGRRYDEVSAWAGLHYFCSRDGLAANAERGAVLTWPQGLAALTGHLRGADAAGPWPSASVASLRAGADGIEALVLVSEHGQWRTARITARQAIAAMPLFVLQHVLSDCATHGFEPARDMPAYAPWLVSNFIMRAFPEEQRGSAARLGQCDLPAARPGLRGVHAPGHSDEPPAAHRVHRLPRALGPRSRRRQAVAGKRRQRGAHPGCGKGPAARLRMAPATVHRPSLDHGARTRDGDSAARLPRQSRRSGAARRRGSAVLRAFRSLGPVAVRGGGLVGLPRGNPGDPIATHDISRIKPT